MIQKIAGHKICFDYSFRNHSRHSHLFEDSTDPQNLPLSDELLFDKGLFAELKLLASKIERGEL